MILHSWVIITLISLIKRISIGNNAREFNEYNFFLKPFQIALLSLIFHLMFQEIKRWFIPFSYHIFKCKMSHGKYK